MFERRLSTANIVINTLLLLLLFIKRCIDKRLSLITIERQHQYQITWIKYSSPSVTNMLNIDEEGVNAMH